jgi:DNA-binding MarR family transcriptional regulator
MYIQVKGWSVAMPPKDTTLDLNGTGYCASFHLRRTARAVTRMYDVVMQETGIRSTQFSILVGIAKNQPVAIGALAEVLILDPTTLTRSLRLLEKEALINISDRSMMRQRFVSITPKGERTLERSVVAWRRAHERFIATVGPEYWNEMRSELEQLARVVVELEEPQKDDPAIVTANA